jgi:hypothetical protein
MNAVDGGNEPRYQLEATRSTLAGLHTRIKEAVNREAEALRERVLTSASARDSVADCQGYIDLAGAYATVAADLLDLGLLDQAETAVELGLAYVEAAEQCLDGVS